MTDPKSPMPDTTANGPKTPGWIKVVLALSLALNVAVVGVVAGAALKSQRTGMMGAGHGDMAFGPFSDALTREQRRALFRGLSGEGPGLREMRRELKADMDRVIATLKTQPFDPAAFRAAVKEQNTRLSARVDDGRNGLIAVIEAMTDAERADFVAKLERRLRDRRPRD